MATPAPKDVRVENYLVVTGPTTGHTFFDDVEENLSNGWKCKGGVSACPEGEGVTLFQAMTKETYMSASEYAKQQSGGGKARNRKTQRRKNRRN